MLFIMLIPSTVWGWEDAQVIGFILTHNPVLQAYRQTATADRLLNRLPIIQARLDERYQAAAALDATEENTARVRQAADDRQAVAQAHRTAAITAPEQAAALKALNQVTRQTTAEVAQAEAALAQARIAASYEHYAFKRRIALTEIGQLRQRLADRDTRRFNEVAKAGEIRQSAFTQIGTLRELEAEHTAATERLGYLKAKTEWLRERMTKGQDGDVDQLWENAAKQNTETATLARLRVLIDSQRRQVAHWAGDQWQPLYRYLADQEKLPP